MMEDTGNRVNEGEAEDANNLKSPDEENACSVEDVTDVYKRISELTDDDIRILEFDSELDGYNFYSEYAKFKGFAVRKDDVYRDRNRLITMRQLVCNRQGERSEKHLNRADRIRKAKAITRTNCLARLRLYFDKNSGKWKVGIFEPEHNHELTPSNMVHLMPAYLVTNGDGAMREAIRSVFPDSIHRLCSWHLHQNACENVKNPKFLEDFKKLIYANYTPEKFEQQWVQVIEKHGLSNNRWVLKVYDLKRMWATAFFRDNFFAGVRTTSICEGINSFTKRYVQSKNSLVDFLHNFERALNEYRHNELASDFKSSYTQPVLTTALEKYEVNACNFYTRNKFFEIRKQIEKVAALNMIERTEVGNVVTLKMNKFGSPDSVYLVLFDKSVGKFVCDCQLFESCGLPCSHIFCAMKHEQIESIPPSLICKRWTKFAKVDYISAIYVDEGDTTKKEVLRSGVVGAACNRLNKAAHKDPHNFVKNIEAIHQLADQMERQDGVDVNIADISRVVRDPTIVKTKGAPCKSKKITKRRKCSYCKRVGHTIRTCSKFSTRDQLHTVEEEESSVESDGESRDLTDTHNHVNTNRSNGVSLSAHGKSTSGQGPVIGKKSNKRMKHDDGVKLTQESVNDGPQVRNVDNMDCSRSIEHVNQMSEQNRGVNGDLRFVHNDFRFTGTYQYQPSMLPHFGHAPFSSRLLPNYPYIPVQQPFSNTGTLHEMNTFGSHHAREFTAALIEVQRKAGVGISFLNPREK
ncbi:Zinc finger, PMZ-type [Sesbania bispinosa]|nr:Zinc finger, PMZ-type [Sesbania bispinosa]